MPEQKIWTREGANAKVGILKTALAASKVRFFKSSLFPTVNTTKAMLVAGECDFSGYTAGGYALATWTGPINNPASGAIMSSPLVNVVFTPPADPDPPVGNAVGGWWIELSAGGVYVVGTFEQPITMNQAGDGFPWVVQIVEGFNAPVAFPE